jgi:anti-sigma-K factor RskA
MNTKHDLNDCAELDALAESLRPVLQDGFRRIGGPGERVLLAIRAEAQRSVRAQRHARFAPLWRLSAAAAAAALIAGAALLTHDTLRAGRHAHTLSQLLDLGANANPTSSYSAETGELAKRLLTVQGLDEEAFMVCAETESLWL